MTVKRYTPTQCCEHDGTYVTYSDYQKLVAENVALKGAIERVSGVYKLSPHIQNLCEVETPASDAAIAEIKSQGVDEYAQSFSENTDMDFACNKGFYHGTLDFAANLRAGRKCNIPPAGWSCTRAVGHDGPCAAVEDADHE